MDKGNKSQIQDLIYNFDFDRAIEAIGKLREGPTKNLLKINLALIKGDPSQINSLWEKFDLSKTDDREYLEAYLESLILLLYTHRSVVAVFRAVDFVNLYPVLNNLMNDPYINKESLFYWHILNSTYYMIQLQDIEIALEELEKSKSYINELPNYVANYHQPLINYLIAYLTILTNPNSVLDFGNLNLEDSHNSKYFEFTEEIHNIQFNVNFIFSQLSGSDITKLITRCHNFIEKLRKYNQIRMISETYYYLGNIHLQISDYGNASKFYNEALRSYKQLIPFSDENILDQLEKNLYSGSIVLEWIYSGLGQYYRYTHDYEKAIRHFDLVFNLRKINPYPLFMTTILIQLIMLGIQINDLDRAEKYLAEFDLYNIDTWAFQARRKLREALILSQSTKIRDRGKAMDFFEQIVKSEALSYLDFKIAIFNLAKLLIEEGMQYNEISSILEAKQHIAKLDTMAIEKKDNSIRVIILLLSSKLDLFANDYAQAQKKLENALQLSREANLKEMEILVISEQKSLENQFLHLKSMVDNNQGFHNQLNELKISKYLQDALDMSETEFH